MVSKETVGKYGRVNRHTVYFWLLFARKLESSLHFGCAALGLSENTPRRSST